MLENILSALAQLQKHVIDMQTRWNKILIKDIAIEKKENAVAKEFETRHSDIKSCFRNTAKKFS